MEMRGFLSQDGILIKKITGLKFSIKNILPLWIESNLIFFDVNLKDESKIDLTIDRNDIVTNDKFNNLKTKIEKIIIDHIEKIFSQKHLVTSKDKNRFMECFFSAFCDGGFTLIPDFSSERLKKLVIFECSVNGEIKYLKYNELKDRWKYFYRVEEKKFRNRTSGDMKKAMEKAYPEDPIIYCVLFENLPGLLIEFSGERIIVTNKELWFSFDKYLLLPSLEKRDKEEYGLTFEGDYKDCFGTFTSANQLRITPNINHPFIRLINKNMDKFKGVDKSEHKFFIDKLLEMERLNFYLISLKGIQRIQKYLLDFYVEKGLLTKEEAEKYILTEKDFCPYDMGEDFLK
jgi:hypothetical protein